VTSPIRQPWPPASFIGRLSDTERAAVLGAGTQVHFDDEQALVVQGDIGRDVYVLTSGLVRVVVAAASGAETTLALRARGDLVGEFAILDELPRTATVRAAGKVTAVRIGRAAFDALGRRYPEIKDVVTRHVVAKMRAETERHAAERVWEAPQRLAQVLYELAETYGQPTAAGEIKLPITQSALGSLAGVATSTAERTLKEFRQRGVIETGYGTIVVRDLDYLGAIRFSSQNRENPLRKGIRARAIGYLLIRWRFRSGGMRRSKRPARGGGRSLCFRPGPARFAGTRCSRYSSRSRRSPSRCGHFAR
jgi:CRP/FNR family transcriptional regulator, cyclic AMP receptor protein